MIIRSELARGQKVSAKDFLASRFPNVEIKGGVSAQYVNLNGDTRAVGVSGLGFDSPFVSILLDNEDLLPFWKPLIPANDVLITADDGVKVYVSGKGQISVSEEYMNIIKEQIDASKSWGGVLNEKGELIADPASPIPGPHYYTNMLIGNRMGYRKPLQSTPKSLQDPRLFRTFLQGQ